jgi:hypothetical protein
MHFKPTNLVEYIGVPPKWPYEMEAKKEPEKD